MLSSILTSRTVLISCSRGDLPLELLAWPDLQIIRSYIRGPPRSEIEYPRKIKEQRKNYAVYNKEAIGTKLSISVSKIATSWLQTSDDAKTE
jgi:hypothetical protein